MSDEVIAFALGALHEMNFDTDGADARTALGPAGIDLDSLAVAELALRLEDKYGIKFAPEDMEVVTVMTLGQLASDVVARAHRPVAR
jgi:acyl carrier protein